MLCFLVWKYASSDFTKDKAFYHCGLSLLLLSLPLCPDSPKHPPDLLLTDIADCLPLFGPLSTLSLTF